MLLINLTGLALIAFIIWWFWLYKSKEVATESDEITIVVDNGVYQPSRIKLSADSDTTLNFIRKDASPCAEMVIFPDLDISENLPVNKVKSIRLPALSRGDYSFHCQMKMYRGELHVE